MLRKRRSLSMTARRSSANKSGGTLQTLSDGGCEAHPPDLYDYTSEATLFQLEDPKLPQVFREDGFVCCHTDFSVSSMAKAIQRLSTGKNERFRNNVVERLSRQELPDFTQGNKIPWVQYEAKTNIQIADVLHSSTAQSIRKLMGFAGYEPELDAIIRNPTLQSLVSALLDCPVDQLDLFQDMALLKPPQGREKPWHQDLAFFDISPSSRVVGCWIAIDAATPENGCLRFQRGERCPQQHRVGRDYQICDAARDGVVAASLPPGGLVLFDGLIPHGTPTNQTTESRRAIQLHWVQHGTPIVARDSAGGRAQVFGSGQGSC